LKASSFSLDPRGWEVVDEIEDREEREGMGRDGAAGWDHAQSGRSSAIMLRGPSADTEAPDKWM
jgi:hypothetical protein